MVTKIVENLYQACRNSYFWSKGSHDEYYVKSGSQHIFSAESGHEKGKSRWRWSQQFRGGLGPLHHGRYFRGSGAPSLHLHYQRGGGHSILYLTPYPPRLWTEKTENYYCRNKLLLLRIFISSVSWAKTSFKFSHPIQD